MLKFFVYLNLCILLQGGLITILLMNQRPDLFKGAILNGPLITLDNLPPGFVVGFNYAPIMK